MREIKFKAIRKDNGKWVYGDLIHGVNHKFGKTYILPVVGGVQPLSGCDPLDGYEVYPETICQFTELKDKNGVEIYEGDIVRFCDDPPYCSDYTIKYDDERLIWIADGVGDFMEDLWELGENYVKVIGNIHDKAQQKQALIDTIRGDEKLGLYDE